ncbi:MAG TPA: xanthine dehydrogenase family protein, partial [Gaiellales bacterium]|nr:xanthine dehydrogenase family protein [Gaiellales bacterium]
MTARLVRTEAVVEGRVEQRYALVEDDDTPEYGPAGAEPVGLPHTRLTAAARLTGGARFTSDLRLPGMLEARVLRSPHANARLLSIDLEAAAAVPGVRAVLPPDGAPTFEGEPVLGREPRFAGAAVAAVAAESGEAAEAGLASLAPVYEPLPFAVDLDAALARQDVIGDPTDSERGDAEAALARAEVTIEAGYSSPAQLHNSMETHCAVADWDADGLTVWSSTQGIYEGRAQLAASFGLERDAVRVICEYMGGGFGSKFGVGHEGVLAAALSRESRRPVRLVYSRRDENTVAGFRTPTHFHFRIGADRDGRLQAIEAEATQEMGDGGWVSPSLVPADVVYACPNVHVMVLGLRQNLG